MEPISQLMSKYAQPGLVAWIGVRPGRRKAVIPLQEATITGSGIEGDHKDTGGKRAVTLVQQEHLPVIASLIGQEAVDPSSLRRNFLVSHINILALRSRKFKIGTAVLEGTGICAPCSRMEEAFGNGGYAAMRGHGGITAKIISPGTVKVGDRLTPIS